ncbi:hypothetical protein LJB93_00500 [Desulfovibrio sp. OttesenSCG-928-F07]|nr:hypothetical protein [Desulfovibrio sp. OttesenSCG-928-F07]
MKTRTLAFGLVLFLCGAFCQVAFAATQTKKQDEALFVNVIDYLKSSEFGNVELERFTREQLFSATPSPSVLKALNEKKVKVTGYKQGGLSPVLYALTYHSENAVLTLINAGLELGGTDTNGNNALGLALLYKKEKAFELLLQKGAELNHVNNEGFSIAHLAALVRSESALRSLTTKGADFNRPDKFGATPLHYVALDMDTTHGIPRVFKMQPVINAKDNEGATPFYRAADFARNAMPTAQQAAIKPWVQKRSRNFNAARIIELTTEAGANASLKDKTGMLPLHYAFCCNTPAKADIVEHSLALLVQCGANNTTANKKGTTPLQAFKASVKKVGDPKGLYTKALAHFGAPATQKQASLK